MFSLDPQHGFFRQGNTKSLAFRKEALQKLLLAIEQYEPALYQAFYQDLHKSEFEAFCTEIGIVKRSIRYMLRRLSSWVKPKRKPTPLLLFGRSSTVFYEPYGSVLILGPFNYPFLTLIEPLAGAIAAGNTAVIKPSEQTPSIGNVIRQMISSSFDPEYIKVILGGIETTESLLEQPFDLIFFTGSSKVGKIIMEKAAKHLTPLVLELGGKSPALVCKDADLKLAAKRIVWGRFLNAGQICIAPDYCLVHESVKEMLVEEMIREIRRMYGKDAALSKDYGRIVAKRHALRLRKIIAAHKKDIVYGGGKKGLYIEPTLLLLDSAEGPAMEEEIFGPLLPVIGFSHPREILAITRKYPKPLALYLFGKDRHFLHQLLHRIPSGGAMINDVLLYAGNEYLPFGGVGNSGMGRYHGKYSMEAFSHERVLMESRFHGSDFLLRAPYSKIKLLILRKFLK